MEVSPITRSLFTVELLAVLRLLSYRLSSLCMNWLRTVRKQGGDMRNGREREREKQVKGRNSERD